MKTSLHFLIAAKQCEIAELRALAGTATLVEVTARLVHGLQRERGLSNLYLGSCGEHFAAERDAQIGETDRLESALRALFDRLDTAAAGFGHGARLFARIAYALQGLDVLPALRSLVLRGAYLPPQATQAYSRLIAGLLAVVFEAADTATDAEVCRLLVGLFNLMQAKELGGQERAAGSSLFASGQVRLQEQQRLQHLIESQERGLEVFAQFARDDILAHWRARQADVRPADLERLRRVLCIAGDGGVLNSDLSGRWFDACTRRIDAMMEIEARLTADLRALCAHKREQLEAELSSLVAIQAKPDGAARPPDPMSVLDDRGGPAQPSAGGPLGPQLERSVLELVQAQAGRLQAMAAELDSVRAALNERKLIERAKGLLMAQRLVTEDEAYRLLRQAAMNQGRRLAEVSEAMLASGPGRPGG